MTHHKTAITGILLVNILFFALPTLAKEVTVDTVDTKSAEWTDCLRLLRLDADIAEAGTYKVRMVNCVNEKIRGSEVGDVNRKHRLSLRAKKVQDAFRARSVDSLQFSKEKYQVKKGNITVFFRKVVPSTYSRPSRRSIKQKATLQQTRSSKARDSQVYQQRWKAAVDACKHISNSFHRENCVRGILR